MAELMTGRALFPGDDRKNSDTFPSIRFKVSNRYIFVQVLCLREYISCMFFKCSARFSVPKWKKKLVKLTRRCLKKEH